MDFGKSMVTKNPTIIPNYSHSYLARDYWNSHEISTKKY
jgi:hypothetical protein